MAIQLVFNPAALADQFKPHSLRCKFAHISVTYRGTCANCCFVTKAVLEIQAPQSRSPPENRGLSIGAEVPVISAVVLQLTSSPTRPSLKCLSQPLA